MLMQTSHMIEMSLFLNLSLMNTSENETVGFEQEILLGTKVTLRTKSTDKSIVENIRARPRFDV